VRQGGAAEARLADTPRPAHQALESTPSGTAVTWRNPDNGHTDTVTPIRTYQTGPGQYCREYTQTVTIDNRPSSRTGSRAGSGRQLEARELSRGGRTDR
jgi:surface antigen